MGQVPRRRLPVERHSHVGVLLGRGCAVSDRRQGPERHGMRYQLHVGIQLGRDDDPERGRALRRPYVLEGRWPEQQYVTGFERHPTWLICADTVSCR
jgi:hypothetical protein